jgi:streptogramin lyase
MVAALVSAAATASAEAKAPMATAAATGAQLPLGERFSGFAVTTAGTAWVSTADLHNRVRMGPLAGHGLRLTSYPVPQGETPFGTVLAREDGGLWFLASTDTAISVGADGHTTEYGPLTGQIESAVVDPGGSLSLSVGRASITTIGISGNISSTTLALPSLGCEPFAQFLDLDRGPGEATWIVGDSTCARSLLREANGNVVNIATAPPGLVPLEYVAADAAAPDGSLWLLGTSDQQWSLRHIAPLGPATSYALPRPPATASEGYNALSIGPDGTPWVGVDRSCTFYRLDGGSLQRTTAPIPEALLSFDPASSSVWLQSETTLRQVPLAALETGHYRCVARIPRLRILGPSTVSIGTLEHSGLTVSVNMPSVLFAALVLADGPNLPSHEIGESSPIVRVLHGRGSLVTFRFSGGLLQRVRQRLSEGRPVFVIPGATHAKSAYAVWGYLKGHVRVTN